MQHIILSQPLDGVVGERSDGGTVVVRRRIEIDAGILEAGEQAAVFKQYRIWSD